jgi:hypothetical protein
MADSQIKTIKLVNKIYDYLIDLNENGLFPFLSDWPGKPFETRTVLPGTLPVVSFLPELAVHADEKAKTMVTMLENSAEHLFWGQTYSPKDFGATFLKKYGWTELIGLRGPIKSKDIACGFLLLGPEIEYPMHSHEAEEVYIPLSSPALWIQGHGHWVSRPSGVPIYHRSWLTHGIRTESMPLLALYLWRGGDLAQKSHID